MDYEMLLMLMKFAISGILSFLVMGGSYAHAQSPMREQALRKAAIEAGVIPLGDIQIETNPNMTAVGEKLFESTLLSFNGETSCQTCHLDKFSSADGLPNAVGTGGHGEGGARMMSGGDIVPRNTLPLWARGSDGFDVFFWDGKVEKVGADIVSQFGSELPSNDPLVVAVHLPFVEIREMVVRDATVVASYETEDTESADDIYGILLERLKDDSELSNQLANAISVAPEDLTFLHVAKAVAEFIRSNFAVKETKFNKFVFHGGKLSKTELQGGLTFFGKGQCSSCHNGPLMTDFQYHVMPFAQLGFGKNGFGIDYGRFNATLNESDAYKFRTPPLVNVAKTAPYSHSGAYKTLHDVIKAHVDPLHAFNGNEYTEIQRREYLARLAKWGQSNVPPEPLSDMEITDLIAYLNTLSSEISE